MNTRFPAPTITKSTPRNGLESITGAAPAAPGRFFYRLRTLRRGPLTLLLAGGLLLAGCGSPESGESLPADHRFPVTLGGQTIRVELALTPEERSLGLMHREEMDRDAGMLFVFDSPRQRHFYMKNTPLPLDIGYFTSDGVLQEVYALHPFDESTVSSRSTRIQFALEMNQGWFPANGIRRAARLDLVDVT